jgi:hypothetical protein
MAPVANTSAGARTWCSVASCQTGTSPSKQPSALARRSTSTPAASASATRRGGAIVAALGEQAPARLEALVGEHDVGARARRRRSRPTGRRRPRRRP